MLLVIPNILLTSTLQNLLFCTTIHIFEKIDLTQKSYPLTCSTVKMFYRKEFSGPEITQGYK